MNAKTNSTEEIVNILIVDDSPTQLEHLKYILEQHSYSVTAANSGRQALSHIGKNRPTLVITDIVMPEMSGYELCQKIKEEEKTRDIPVILLTSLSSTEDVLEGLACGADNFISKPYSEQYLLTNIVNILVNAKLRKSEYVRMGMEIQFGGKKRFITADQQQMLSMLISTYEAAVNRNKELIQAQNELKTINDNLEDMVETRTAQLMAEVAERKRSEMALRQSEGRYRAILEDIQEGYFEVDLAGNFTFFNNSMCRILGYSRKELIGMNNRQYTDKENAKQVFQTFNDVYNTGEQTEGFDWQVIRKDGTKRYVEASVSLKKDSSGKLTGFRGIARDVTERKQAEETLQKSETRYHFLFDNMLNGFAYCRMIFEQGQPPDILYLDVNKSFELLTGLKDVVGKKISEILPGIQELDPELFEIYGRVSSTGNPEKFEFYSKALKQWLSLSVYSPEKEYFVAVFDIITNRKYAELALRDSEARLNLAMETNQIGVWELNLLDHKAFRTLIHDRIFGYETLLPSWTYQMFLEHILPEDCQEVERRFNEATATKSDWNFECRIHRTDGEVRWILAKGQCVLTSKGEPLKMLGIVQDITERKRAEEKLQQTLESLRKSFGATIQALVSAVEMRDPYTAGHQQRVATIACDIAKEMGLPDDRIEGIRMAGSIHDIGKLSIPAEILVKPTKLTNNEFSITKEHSQIGYEMLKDVESPWPLAQVVYQHHERMNGSGYPRNLKGNEILLEARIMAVADVLEAMASHRPYRPALGIDEALAEIEKNRETLYDKTVAETCLRLFREKGYQLK